MGLSTGVVWLCKPELSVQVYCLQVYSSGVHYCLENGLTASLMEGERAGRTERERRERGKGGRERREGEREGREREKGGRERREH